MAVTNYDLEEFVELSFLQTGDQTKQKLMADGLNVKGNPAGNLESVPSVALDRVGLDLGFGERCWGQWIYQSFEELVSLYLLLWGQVTF